MGVGGAVEALINVDLEDERRGAGRQLQQGATDGFGSASKEEGGALQLSHTSHGHERAQSAEPPANSVRLPATRSGVQTAAPLGASERSLNSGVLLLKLQLLQATRETRPNRSSLDRIWHLEPASPRIWESCWEVMSPEEVLGRERRRRLRTPPAASP